MATRLTDKPLARAADATGPGGPRGHPPADGGRWTFVFGPDHVHPETGESLGGCYVQVPGGEDTARERMCAVFGLHWSMQYPTPERQVRRGMREIPWPGGLR